MDREPSPAPCGSSSRRTTAAARATRGDGGGDNAAGHASVTFAVVVVCKDARGAHQRSERARRSGTLRCQQTGSRGALAADTLEVGGASGGGDDDDEGGGGGPAKVVVKLSGEKTFARQRRSRRSAEGSGLSRLLDQSARRDGSASVPGFLSRGSG